MADLLALKKKYDTAEDLLSVVKTMKAMAAVNIREYEKAQGSLESYNYIIRLAFQGLLRSYLPGNDQKERSDTDRTVLIVFGSDQGLCGQFNDRIVEHTLSTLRDLHIDPRECIIMVLGERAGNRILSEGLEIQQQFPVPGSPEGITPTVQEIITTIDQWNIRSGLGRVILEYNHHISGASYEPRMVRLLPLDREWLLGIAEEPWPSRVLPTFRMDKSTIFSTLVRHYLNVTIFRAFTESLSSENAARLASMQGAEKNIKERLIELKNQYNQQRQVSITEELLDIISGFNAMQGENKET